MIRLKLKRLLKTDHGTFGMLIIPKRGFLCYTGELPWKENKSNISCIPKGVYECIWNRSPKFKKMMYLIKQVKNRNGIRIHSANFMGDRDKGFKYQLYGCISFGKRIAKMDGQLALLMSRPAIRKVENYLNHKSFELEVN